MSCNQSSENVNSLSKYFSSYLNDVNRDKNPDLKVQIDFDRWAETYKSDENFLKIIYTSSLLMLLKKL